uniref:Uncharacterized protein n=1 Tax=Plectus sambesii TaxID=2011161 RepID=A0A914XNY1_9BILA
MASASNSARSVRSAKGVSDALFAISRDELGAYFFERPGRSLSYLRFSDDERIPFEMDVPPLIEGNDIEEFTSLATVMGKQGSEFLILILKTKGKDNSVESAGDDHDDGDGDDGDGDDGDDGDGDDDDDGNCRRILSSVTFLPRRFRAIFNLLTDCCDNNNFDDDIEDEDDFLKEGASSINISPKSD